MNTGEEIFVEHSKEQINNAIDEAIAVGRKYITIIHLDRDIYFNYISDKKRKTKYIALEAPKTPKKELTQEDRVKRDIMLAKILKDTAEGRKKRFFKYREEELKLLSIREQGHGLETTLSKLRRLKEYEEREIKEDFKNNK